MDDDASNQVGKTAIIPKVFADHLLHMLVNTSTDELSAILPSGFASGRETKHPLCTITSNTHLDGALCLLDGTV